MLDGFILHFLQWSASDGSLNTLLLMLEDFIKPRNISVIFLNLFLNK
jgi:hypothetical protein